VNIKDPNESCTIILIFEAGDFSRIEKRIGRTTRTDTVDKNTRVYIYIYMRRVQRKSINDLVTGYVEARGCEVHGGW